MPEQNDSPALDPHAAAEALRLLEEAWSYWSPGPLPDPAGNDYESIPFAA